MVPSPGNQAQTTNNMKLHHLLLTAALAGGLTHIALGQGVDTPPAQPPAGGPAVGGPGGPGRAGGPGGFARRGGDPTAAFKRMDADSDGKISKDEYLKGPRAAQDPTKAAERFAKMDKDSDGFVTLEEFKAARPAVPRPQGKGPQGGVDTPKEGAPPPPPAKTE